MKIAIMMRAMDQDSGHRAIIEGLVEHMLHIAISDTFLLLFRTTKWLGHFASYNNAKEILLKAPHKLIWDQVAVPFCAWREGADIIFNPKFSVPLISSCPVVMGLHEPAWWAWPDHYEWFDRNYMKFMLPMYVKKSKHLFPISQFVVDENREYVGLPFKNVTVSYPAPKAYFQKIDNEAHLLDIRNKYSLPEHFILTVTRVDHPGLDKSTSFFPGKNVETTVRAFIKIRDQVPHTLVIAGRKVREYLYHIGFSEADLNRVDFKGFVPHEELPGILNLSEVFVLPSFYESYAMALVEAMSCGCAIVASETGACPEITGGAALLADPNKPSDFAEKIINVLKDRSLKKKMHHDSLDRARYFTWERSAKMVLGKMHEVIGVPIQVKDIIL